MKEERVLIVGVETEENYRTFHSSLTEMRQLVQAAHGEVVAVMEQKRPVVNRQTIVGKGKLAEIALAVDAEEIDIVIFNHELTPRQHQTLSDRLQVLVIDRVQLILDIFALRARSKEGKLQVELAQLNYLLPRLVGQGAAMSRLGAGIGTRGPGETKLETDRRHIRNRMTKVKRELKELAAHRERTREKRRQSQLIQVGLIGYTNAGKSTLLNRLTDAQTFEKDQLFATLDPLTKKWRLPEGLMLTLTDTVGFMQDLPTQLIDAFHSTLEESRAMDILLHVVDASASDRQIQEKTVLALMKELGLDHIPVLTVYNKADKLEEENFIPTLFPNILISAYDKESIALVSKGIKQLIMEKFEPYVLSLPDQEAYRLANLERQTLVVAKEYDEEHGQYEVKGFVAPENRTDVSYSDMES